MFTKLFKWLTVSNRPKHFYAGLMIYFLSFLAAVLSILALNIDNYSTHLIAAQSLFTVFASMCTVEYTQHNLCHAGKFDLLDIAAGCLVPLILTILIAIFV